MEQPRLGLYEKALPADMSWQDRFQTAKQLGFDFIEISIDETDSRLERLNWDDVTIREVRDASLSEGVALHSMCLSAHRRFPYGSTDPLICQRADDIMQSALILASKLGIRVIQLAGYDVYYEE